MLFAATQAQRIEAVIWICMFFGFGQMCRSGFKALTGSAEIRGAVKGGVIRLIAKMFGM